MSEQPEGFTPPEDDSESNSEENPPLQGEIHHSNISAIIPEGVSRGIISNGVMILTGSFEIVLDFVLRIGEQQRVVVRCILPKPVAVQFVNALRENIQNYESRFGAIPPMPLPIPVTPEQDDESAENAEDTSNPPLVEGGNSSPTIQDLYDELKISDDVMTGNYANAVLIRHTGTEFCFDFITNFYPRSAVSSRVFMATPHARPLLSSLEKAMHPPGTSQDFA